MKKPSLVECTYPKPFSLVCSFGNLPNSFLTVSSPIAAHVINDFYHLQMPRSYNLVDNDLVLVFHRLIISWMKYSNARNLNRKLLVLRKS